MKFKVHNLSGRLTNDGPIQIKDQQLLQAGQVIGSLSDKDLEVLIKNRQQLESLKFVDEKVNHQNELIEVKLLVLFKETQATLQKKNVSYLKIGYYLFTIIASMICIIYSWQSEVSLWLILFFFAVMFSSTVLLIGYLYEIGYLNKDGQQK